MSPSRPTPRPRRLRKRGLARETLLAATLSCAVLLPPALGATSQATFVDSDQATGNTMASAVLQPPGSLTITNPDPSKNTLTWTASPSRDVDGYYIYRSSAASGPWTQVGSVSGKSTTTWTDPTTPAGTSYYNVQAYRVNWISGTTNTSPGTSATAPAAPSNAAATLSGTTATITFTPPTNDGGATITSYTVTSNTGGFTATGTGSPLTITGLSSGITYTFTVTATNAAGTSAPSAPSNAVTPAPAGNWLLQAPVPVVTYGHGAATLPDGRILIAGGRGNNTSTGYYNTSRIYNPTTNTWATGGTMPAARAYVAVAASGGKVYSIGGGDDTIYNNVFAYTPASNSWSSVAGLPRSTDGMAAATATDGTIYAFGGRVGSRAATSGVAYVYRYTPASNSWTTAPSMPVAAQFPAATTGADGRIYVTGGMMTNGLVSDRLDIYNPSTNTWTTGAAMPRVRYGHTMVTGNDGRLYAIGGYTSSGGLANVDVYNPSTNTWSAGVNLPTDKFIHASTRGTDGRLYTIGGSGNAGNSSEVLTYLP